MKAHRLRPTFGVIGGGPAGITLALGLSKLNYSICLLESGGLNYEAHIQKLYDGESKGRFYQLQNSRLRFLGGSSNHWSGHCRPLNKMDFEKRAWVSGSGWPFPIEEISDYYQKAEKLLGLDPFNTTVNNSGEEGIFRDISLPSFNNEYLHSRAVHFGQEFHKKLSETKNIVLYLYANQNAFEFDDDRLQRLQALTDEGRSFHVKARVFVLAAGGIENARILLDSVRNGQRIPGNQCNLVGRRFMEHFHIPTGFCITPAGIPLQALERKDSMYCLMSDRDDRLGYFGASETTQQERKILNFRIQLGPEARLQQHMLPFDDDLSLLTGEMIFENNKISQQLASQPLKKFLLYTISEQAPDVRSKVELLHEKDRLGRPKILLNWHMSDLDKHTIHQSLHIFARDFIIQNLGRVQILPEKMWIVEGGYHHMGTTCMHRMASKGVVDENSLVHGTKNLYIAGSSIFPTGGHANPTLTIVALAMRLVNQIGMVLS